MEYIAVLRIKGNVKVPEAIQNTLHRLNLNRKNHLVFYEKNDAVLGMVKRVKDYVTYGEVDESFVKEVLEKRGDLYESSLTDSKKLYEYKSRFFEFGKKKYKKAVRLNPPVGGFERKGTKKGFNQGGSLGYRGDKIKDLISKML